MGTPHEGSTSPWFHVAANPRLGLNDAALEVALAAAFQLDAASGSWTLPSNFSLVSVEIPAAGLSDFALSMGTESHANAAVPEPSSLLPIAFIACGWVIRRHRHFPL
jgi:hypothetical protein